MKWCWKHEAIIGLLERLALQHRSPCRRRAGDGLVSDSDEDLETEDGFDARDFDYDDGADFEEE